MEEYSITQIERELARKQELARQNFEQAKLQLSADAVSKPTYLPPLLEQYEKEFDKADSIWAMHQRDQARMLSEAFDRAQAAMFGRRMEYKPMWPEEEQAMGTFVFQKHYHELVSNGFHPAIGSMSGLYRMFHQLSKRNLLPLVRDEAEAALAALAPTKEQVSLSQRFEGFGMTYDAPESYGNGMPSRMPAGFSDGFVPSLALLGHMTERIFRSDYVPKEGWSPSLRLIQFKGLSLSTDKPSVNWVNVPGGVFFRRERPVGYVWKERDLSEKTYENVTGGKSLAPEVAQHMVRVGLVDSRIGPPGADYRMLEYTAHENPQPVKIFPGDVHFFLPRGVMLKMEHIGADDFIFRVYCEPGLAELWAEEEVRKVLDLLIIFKIEWLAGHAKRFSGYPNPLRLRLEQFHGAPQREVQHIVIDPAAMSAEEARKAAEYFVRRGATYVTFKGKGGWLPNE